MDKSLSNIMLEHWQQLRSLTYDLLANLSANQLNLTLPFERSQDIKYQFWCMLGAQESWIALIETGEWAGFSCSINSVEGGLTIENFRQQLQLADQALLKALQTVPLTNVFANGSTAMMHYMKLVEHEAHHQGQLINFIYAHDLPIPPSWEAKWSLRRD